MKEEDIIKGAINDSFKSKERLDGIGFIGDGKAEFISFDKIEVTKKRKQTINPNLEEWVPKDFVIYTRNLFQDRYNTDWDLNFGGSCLEVQKVEDSLSELLGFNGGRLALKDYIDFFFENYCDDFMKKNHQFYFSYMRKPWVLESFYESYDYADSLKGQKMVIDLSKSKDVDDKMKSVTHQEMEDTFFLSDERFVGEYGALLTVNWLIVHRGFAISDATKYVYLASKKLYDSNRSDVLKLATERYNPYPDALEFKQAPELLQKLGDISVHLEWTEENRFPFLVKSKD